MRPFSQRLSPSHGPATGAVVGLTVWLAAATAFAQGTAPPPTAPPVAAAPRPALLGTKKPITHDVYDGWRSIQGTKLSRDGAWLVYALVPQDGDGELVARSLKTDAEYRTPRGRSPKISFDGKFVAFAITPTKAETDKAKKEKKKPEDQPKNGLGLMDLSTGRVTVVERVKSFAVPEKGGARWLVYLRETAPPAPNNGGARRGNGGGPTFSGTPIIGGGGGKS